MTEVKKHNHITRDIKPLGVCPACDEYHNRKSTSAVNKLTDWEIGQELVKVFDTICDARKDLRTTSPLIAHELSKIANKVGHIFNNLKSHSFLLPEDLK